MEPEYLKINKEGLVVFDTHAHVSTSPFNEDRDQVIKRARLSGIGFLEVGFDEESSRKSLNLAQSLDGYCAVGIHPHDTARQQSLECRWKYVEDLAQSPQVKAIGEIGLDYFREFSPKQSQIEGFCMGLEVAGRTGLPVIIHQRDSSDDVINVINNCPPGTPLIFHCFSQELGYARKCLDLGGYIGLGGSLTYPRNDYLRDILRFLPPDRLLVETDCPYLPPQSKRGKRNEPSYIVEVVNTIAQILEVTFNEIAEITLKNALRVFAIGE